MTIALGILGRNFVLIAADTEGTLGYTKFQDHKVGVGVCLASEGPRIAIMSGAGSTHMIEAFVAHVNQKTLYDARITDDPHTVFDQAMERFYTSKVVPLSNRPSDEFQDFSMVLGYRDTVGLGLYVSHATTFAPRHMSVVVGAGQLVAVPILNRMLTYPVVRLEQAIVAASYAILVAKESIGGVGKQTDIRYVTKDGTMVAVTPPEQERIDAALKRYESHLGPAALNAVAGLWSPDRVQAEVEAIRGVLADVLKRHSTPVSRKPADRAAKQAPQHPKRAKQGRPPSQE